jgi:nicotinate-nucleotide pyrophosphorylase (carboxylating)
LIRLEQPPAALIDEAIARALAEDLGRAGDITTEATVDAGSRSSARIVARRPGTISGLPIARRVFARLDADVRFEAGAADGDAVEAGAIVARLSGSSRALLTGERVALNFLGHLSGIATATRALVDAVAGTGAAIVDTRKTTPGLRALEKYAVRCGGGGNHRFGLDDAVLIKDNHLVAAGGVAEAIRRARARAGHMVKIECEVKTLAELEKALGERVDALLLDNMTPEELRAAVARVRERAGNGASGRVLTEASGGITLANVRAVAESGVDLISVGWITHSAPCLDVALDFD